LSRDYAQNPKEKECKEIASNLISDAYIAVYASKVGNAASKVGNAASKVGSD
jgi:hypothetical protein